MKWLNYHHLYYFRTIAQEAGIAKAAVKLRLGQPTLSSQLKQLESNLGCQLFERKNRSLVLTEAGKIALEYADEIFRSGDQLLQILGDGALTGRTDVKVGALDSVPKSLLVKIVQEVLKEKNTSISLFEGGGDEIFRDLFNHQLDVIVSNYPPSGLKYGKIFTRSIAKVPVAVYAPAHLAHLKKGFPNSLDGQSFILPTGHSKLRHDLDHYFKLNRLRIIPLVETQDTSLQKLLGIEGYGLLPLPEFSATELVGKNRMVKLGFLSNVLEEFWLISASRKLENAIASKLMQNFQLKF